MLLENGEFVYPDNTLEVLTEYINLKRQGKKDEAHEVLRANLPIPPYLSAGSILVYGEDYYEKAEFKVWKQEAAVQADKTREFVLRKHKN